jgi:flagellar basal-body rod protein FlgB
MVILNDRTLQTLEKSLECSLAKNKAIAHNIANVNTPKFKSVEVSFKDQLKNALDLSNKISLNATSDKHMSNKSSLKDISPKIEKNQSISMRADGSNVDIDKEFTDLVKNSMYHNATITQLNKRLQILKYTISEGRG